jgi:predicted HTH transcriptional regulator
MQIDTLKEIIKQGEGLKTEFKKSRNKLPGNLFETVCAFLNTKGGNILLGVEDDGTVAGVNSGLVNRFKKEIANLANNQEKLSPSIMINLKEFKIDDKIIIFFNKTEKIKRETTQKTTQKILEIIRVNPRVSRRELAKLIDGITEDGIKYHLNKLKEQGVIKRVGPDKGGVWQIISDPENDK